MAARGLHSGDFIRTEMIEPSGLLVTAVDTALHVSRPALSGLLTRKAALPGEMALRIEKGFRVKMEKGFGVKICPTLIQ